MLRLHPILSVFILSLACARSQSIPAAPAEPPVAQTPPVSEPPPAPEEPKPDPQVQADAAAVYTYAYPLVLMDVTREVMTSQVPTNSFQHMRTFPDPTFKDVVSPNADTLYSSAWLDLSKEPVVLSVPDMGKRYYLLPMLDAWTNVFASPGSRTTGQKAGNFAVVGPHWQGQLPTGVTEIRAPTDMVWIIGRIETRGKADFAAVNKLQDQLRLTPLSGWDTQTVVEPPPPTTGADTTTPPVDQVANMRPEQFFARVADLLPENPAAAADAPMLDKMATIKLSGGTAFNLADLPPPQELAIREGAKAALTDIVAATKSLPGEPINGWRIFRDLGSYGTDYMRRAMVAHMGLGANLPEDAIYPVTRVDSDNQPLSGANRYTLHFARGELPPVDGFWSLTMYNEQQFFVENPLNRFAIGDRDKLKRNKDGSIDLYIQPESPGKAKEANWLPAPAGEFNLMMRLYWPKEPVLKGEWNPPAVVRAP